MPAATAYSYLRFSSPEQAKGDSLRRQTEARDHWLADHPGVALDKTLTMTDAGRSAFRREKWDTYALARFVDHVKSGRVEKGSYLLVENLDRLSREDAGDAVELFLSIVNRGVTVVQLMPVVMEFKRPVNTMSLMFAIVELSRGHSESAAKSIRITAVWDNKRKHAATQVVTRKLPGWVRCEDSKLKLDQEKAATVRRVFDMAVKDLGCLTIAKRLNAERVPVIGRKSCKGKDVVWSTSNVFTLLKSRAAFGEYQPHKGVPGNRQPIGAPIPHYYPAAIDETTFYAAQEAMKRRTTLKGRRGNQVNLFTGLLRDARDGGTMTYKKNGNGRGPAIVPVAANAGKGAPYMSFPAIPLEQALRSSLVEIPAEEIFGGDDTLGRKVEALGGRKAELEGLVKHWTAKMDDPNLVDVVSAKLSEFNGKLKQVAAELAEAQREAASPVSEAWGEFRTLAGMDPKQDTDDRRELIRAALRRSVDSVYCIFAGRGRLRLAYVQVWFRSGGYRTFTIIYSPRPNGRVHREGYWSCSTWKFPEDNVKLKKYGFRPLNPPDLRTPEGAAGGISFLETYPQEVIDHLLAGEDR